MRSNFGFDGEELAIGITGGVLVPVGQNEYPAGGGVGQQQGGWLS